MKSAFFFTIYVLVWGEGVRPAAGAPDRAGLPAAGAPDRAGLPAAGAPDRAGLPAGVLPGMPAGCAGATYCHVKHPHYPHERIAALLHQHNVSLWSAPPRSVLRDGEWEGEPQDDCPAHATLEPLYEVEVEGEVRAVVQAARLRQAVRLERCAGPARLRAGSAHLARELLAEHEVRCEQTRAAAPLLLLARAGDRLELRAVPGLPVHCACRYVGYARAEQD